MSSKPHSTEPEHPFLWLLGAATAEAYRNRDGMWVLILTADQRDRLIRALEGWKGEAPPR